MTFSMYLQLIRLSQVSAKMAETVEILQGRSILHRSSVATRNSEKFGAQRSYEPIFKIETRMEVDDNLQSSHMISPTVKQKLSPRIVTRLMDWRKRILGAAGFKEPDQHVELPESSRKERPGKFRDCEKENCDLHLPGHLDCKWNPSAGVKAVLRAGRRMRGSVWRTHERYHHLHSSEFEDAKTPVNVQAKEAGTKDLTHDWWDEMLSFYQDNFENDTIEAFFKAQCPTPDSFTIREKEFAEIFTINVLLTLLGTEGFKKSAAEFVKSTHDIEALRHFSSFLESTSKKTLGESGVNQNVTQLVGFEFVPSRKDVF